MHLLIGLCYYILVFSTEALNYFFCLKASAKFRIIIEKQ
jgi:hypothetical protein